MSEMLFNNSFRISLDRNDKEEIGLQLERLSLSRLHFFKRGTTEESLNCLEKTPELKDRLFMMGRSACKHCFRMEVGIGSRSQKVLDDCEMSLQISSLVAGLRRVKLVGTSWVQCDMRFY